MKKAPPHFPRIGPIAFEGPAYRQPAGLPALRPRRDRSTAGRWRSTCASRSPTGTRSGASAATRSDPERSTAVGNREGPGLRGQGPHGRGLRILPARSGRRSGAFTTATSPPRAGRSRSPTAISTGWWRTPRRSRRTPASGSSGAPPTSSPTPATCAARRPTPTPTFSPTPRPR